MKTPIFNRDKPGISKVLNLINLVDAWWTVGQPARVPDVVRDRKRPSTDRNSQRAKGVSITFASTKIRVPTRSRSLIAATNASISLLRFVATRVMVLYAVGKSRRNIRSEAQALQCPQRAHASVARPNGFRRSRQHLRPGATRCVARNGERDLSINPAFCRWRETMEALPSVQRFRASLPPRAPIEHAREWAVSHRPKY